MKSAMQELIETLINFKKELKEKYDDDPLVIRGVSISIVEANKLLEKEKQQIIEIITDAKMEGHGLPVGMEYYNMLHDVQADAERYYNQIFKQ